MKHLIKIVIHRVCLVLTPVNLLCLLLVVACSDKDSYFVNVVDGQEPSIHNALVDAQVHGEVEAEKKTAFREGVWEYSFDRKGKVVYEYISEEKIIGAIKVVFSDIAMKLGEEFFEERLLEIPSDVGWDKKYKYSYLSCDVEVRWKRINDFTFQYRISQRPKKGTLRRTLKGEAVDSQ